MDTKEKTIEESPEALLKQGQQTVEVLQSKIQRGTTQLDGWKAQLDAQQSYNEKLAAGLGSSKKGRKKKAAAKKAAAKTAAKAAKPAKKAPKKAKAAPAAKPAKKVAKKAGKKKAAKAAAAPVAKKGQKVSARKAVASGDLPSLTKRLIEVMGKEDVGIPEVITRLAQKGWTPDSKDLPTYISYMLSSNKETFERVSRGVYRVSKAAANGKGPKGAKGKVSPAKTNGVAPKRKKAAAAAATAPAAPEPTPSQAEQELAELGATDGTVPSNPFAL